MEENQRRKAFYEQLGLPAPAIEQLERMKKHLIQNRCRNQSSA